MKSAIALPCRVHSWTSGRRIEPCAIGAGAHLTIGRQHRQLECGAALGVTASKVSTAKRELHRRLQVPAKHSEHHGCQPSTVTSIHIRTTSDKIARGARLAGGRKSAESRTGHLGSNVCHAARYELPLRSPSVWSSSHIHSWVLNSGWTRAMMTPRNWRSRGANGWVEVRRDRLLAGSSKCGPSHSFSLSAARRRLRTWCLGRRCALSGRRVLLHQSL